MLRRILSTVLVLCFIAVFAIQSTAANFTESAEAKPAVNLVEELIENTTYVGTIYDENGNVLSYVPKGEIIITPYSEVHHEDTHPEIRERLLEAYGQLKETEDLRHLCEMLEAEVNRVAENLHFDHVSVCDLMDVHLTEDFEHFLEDGKNYLEITFDLGVDADLIVAVLHNIAGDEWETLVGDRVKRDGNKLTCVFYSLSPVVFLIDDSALYVDPDAPQSPQTGETVLWQVPAFVGVAVFVTAVVIFKKRIAEN